MSPTLAHRPPGCGPRAAEPPAPDGLDAVSMQAMQTVRSLLRAGARLERVERGCVVMRRQAARCVVDAAGRLSWSVAP